MTFKAGEVRRSYQQLGDELGVCVSTMQRYVSILIKLGIIMKRLEPAIPMSNAIDGTGGAGNPRLVKVIDLNLDIISGFTTNTTNGSEGNGNEPKHGRRITSNDAMEPRTSATPRIDKRSTIGVAPATIASRSSEATANGIADAVKPGKTRRRPMDPNAIPVASSQPTWTERGFRSVQWLKRKLTA